MYVAYIVFAYLLTMPSNRTETLTPLSAAILFALADGASHGYAIIKEIEELTDGEMSPHTGSMYLALHRLLEDGLIAEAPTKGEDARRRYYKLSDAGREAARLEARRLAQLVKVASAKRLIPRSAL
jgi:DNA-binding PadR family transcriptional regulator